MKTISLSKLAKAFALAIFTICVLLITIGYYSPINDSYVTLIGYVQTPINATIFGWQGIHPIVRTTNDWAFRKVTMIGDFHAIDYEFDFEQMPRRFDINHDVNHPFKIGFFGMPRVIWLDLESGSDRAQEIFEPSEKELVINNFLLTHDNIYHWSPDHFESPADYGWNPSWDCEEIVELSLMTASEANWVYNQCGQELLGTEDHFWIQYLETNTIDEVRLDEDSRFWTWAQPGLYSLVYRDNKVDFIVESDNIPSQLGSCTDKGMITFANVVFFESWIGWDEVPTLSCLK